MAPSTVITLSLVEISESVIENIEQEYIGTLVYLCRYPRFFQSLLNSPGRELRVISRIVSRDVRSTTGKNLALIRHLTGLKPCGARAQQLRQKLLLSELLKFQKMTNGEFPTLEDYFL